MSNSMLKSITLHPDIDNTKRYHSFSATKQMIYLIHHLLLCDYVSMFAGTLVQKPDYTHYDIATPLNLRTYRNTLMEKALVIPKTDFNTGIYSHYHDLLFSLCKGDMPSADDLIDLFMDSHVLEDPDLQIPKEFLLPFIFSVNGTTIAKDRISSNVDLDSDAYLFYNPIIYTPRYELSKEYGLRMILDIDPDLQVPCFSLDNFTDMQHNLPLPYRYVASMDWRGRSLTHVLGLLERFSLEHDSHVMQNDSVCTVGDLCYDIVTHSDYCRNCTPSNFNAFISCCKYLCETWNVQVDDTAYLGELLKCSNGDMDVVNYLQKSVDQITVAEMEAFQSSVFATFVHKTVSATEAADPNTDEDDDKKNPKEEGDAQAGTTDTPEDTNPDAPAGTDDTTGDMPTDDPDAPTDTGDLEAPEDTESDSEDTPAKKVERKIPPATDGILLELLNPENETLSDHLYRKEFLIRVNDLLQNPSGTRCDSQTLFMLKEWASKWLYIFSVASLKSFLKNINFNVMAKQ